VASRPDGEPPEWLETVGLRVEARRRLQAQHFNRGAKFYTGWDGAIQSL
jgi:hypothetical protein